MTKRRFLHAAAISTTLVLAGMSISSCHRRVDGNPKLIVLGFDGMDPRLCERLMAQGKMPHLAQMRDGGGGYKPLGTSIPPQSPVAWSNFITGAGPGVHGIFDFIHRNPAKQCEPFYSAAETVHSDDGWDIGKHKIPLAFWPFQHNPTQTLLRRHGIPFWDYLDEAGVPSRIYDIPSNYPPSPSHHGHMCCLAGMGVPDLLGGYGTYQYFSSDTLRSLEEPGGYRKPLVFQGDFAKGSLIGPENTTLKKPAKATVPFQVYRHPTDANARIEWQDQVIVLKEGEWSDWCKVDYELEMPSFLPNTHVSGICRFYLQQVRPTFRLYVTPINIDPSDPGGQRVTEPADFIKTLAKALGLFYTTGFQEDHKALANRVFRDEEYVDQARSVLQERMRLFHYAMDNYHDGFLFFYFSSTDLQAHMFWWNGDEPHPVRSPEKARRFNGVIEDLYVEMDKVVGEVVDRYGRDATILVMSDHGFCNFRRQFNVNTWLRDQGYLGPSDCRSLLNPGNGRLVDWKRTRAYGLGLNGLYLNLRGRERDGVVEPADREALLEEIRGKLLAVRDPMKGEPVIAKVYRSDEVYSGPYAAKGPDLIIGYDRGYRASWATTTGDLENDVISNNDSAWSADHCIAADQVPGVIFSNRPILREAPTLIDLAPTILEQFAVSLPDTMKGRSLFKPAAEGAAPAAGKE
jgi:predicted AlkP superfamily phosphohydrolase/phosphomutase